MDFGEILAVARAIDEGDDGAFYSAWVAAGDRFAAAANEAITKRRRPSARSLFLKASCAYATAYHPLYGEPADERLLIAFRKQIGAFNWALTLSDPPVAPLRIPFVDGSLPAYLIPAEGRATEVRPLLILNNGYDATVTDMYFASAVAASRRGYHCLLFDGPGQGAMLFEMRRSPAAGLGNGRARGRRFRGRSAKRRSGAHCAQRLEPWRPPRARAASAEHRLAACIADPGQWSIADGFRGAAIKLGATPEAVADLGAIDQALLERLEQTIFNNRKLKWSVVQRGFWVHGVSDLRAYLRSVEQFTMEGRAELIRCPMLLTLAENDPLATNTPAFFDALRCPKALIKFTAAEGAGEHCEMMSRSLLNGRVLDWLDDVLA